MPLWFTFHLDGTLSDVATKAALLGDITAFCIHIGLPAFYVVVSLVNMPSNTIWVGGEPISALSKPFIQLAIGHIAVNLPDDDTAYMRTSDGIDVRLNEHVDAAERRLWRINGLIAPAFGSEGEKVWAKESKAVPWEGDGSLKS